MGKAAVALFLILVVSIACSPKERVYKKSKMLMNTIVTITVVSASESKADEAIDEAFHEIERIEKKVNFYSAESEISSINKAAGIDAARVSFDTMYLVEKALYVSEKTEGAFDITIGPVAVLYDFSAKIKPEERDLRNAISLVNYRKVILDRKKSTVHLPKKGMLIDMGGISKGYAADRAADVLEKEGIASGIVAVAGDIKAFGLKPDGKPWKIGIRNPRAKSREDDVLATLEITDVAISTSGDYERFFIVDGTRYHHLLSPKTGRPAGGCRSVTIIVREGALADALATGVFVRGPEDGLQILRFLGYDAVIVDSRGGVHVTPNLRGKIEFRTHS
ncbi:MAG: FAD:protein FMN transferase [Nitrospirota bacterium]